MKIAIAQANPKTGDLEGNVSQILDGIRRAEDDSADLVVFPELMTTGYCCGALFEEEDFVIYNKRFLEEIIVPEINGDMAAIIGFVDIKGRKKDGRLDITNSAALIQDKRIVGIYDKILLADQDQHEDKRYFSPGKDSHIFDIVLDGKKQAIGIPICEDVWNTCHERDIVREMKDKGADMIISLNQSYFHYGKQEDRKKLLSDHAKDKEIPIISVNSVGVGDILKNIMIYDGGSMAFDKDGSLISLLKRFAPDYHVLDLDSVHKISPSPISKYQEIYEALCFAQKEVFAGLGIKNAQVHLSGGIDSAVVAALCKDAMGPDQTILISNPTEHNSGQSRDNAQRIADVLGIKLYWNSCQIPYDGLVKEHRLAFGTEPTLTGKGCMQAVLRTVQGIGAYHTFKSGIVAAGNHTEIVLGWSTFHDIGSIGVHSLIGDLTKMEVYGLAKYINERNGKMIIPEALYDGTIKPAAELADAGDDPIDYYIMSGICAELIRERKSINGLVGSYMDRSLSKDYFPDDILLGSVYDRYSEQEFIEAVLDASEKSRHSVFKAAQAAPIVIVSKRSRGFSSRETIINGYDGWYDLDRIRSRIGDMYGS